MWLDDGRTGEGWTDETVRDYKSNISRFLLWCANEQVEEVGELTPWDIELFRQDRQNDTVRSGEKIAPSTLRGSMMTLKQFVDYLVRIGGVDDEVGEAAAEAVPTLSKEDATSDDMLNAEDALALLDYYRNSARDRATDRHVVLEILWHTGCRRGGIRALDLEDYHPEERTLTFVNRPESGTRLKRGDDGERTVLLSPTVCEVIDEYIARERYQKRDEYGREPLLSFRQDRPSVATIQSKSYLATQPCVYRECPHGERPRECLFRERTHSSKCPSSRSPHAVRTGSITWHRDRGVPIEETATRVNATADTIEKYYDKADADQELERRRQYTENLDITEN
ncbi:tyrosine-type recombinase/integrase [Halorarius halobius]|uniref:tyrosine-type recombinase/integrase n=1 Tax=Halorarius halobius TaxID=2962671 RepID=UPI0020CF4065|nr:site-specific integrase [Halorarius halobius]